jgi:hypothetical protein
MRPGKDRYFFQSSSHARRWSVHLTQSDVGRDGKRDFETNIAILLVFF